MKKFTYIKALFSPFKPFEVKVYVGKTRIGVPYFLPRKWVKATPELAKKAALEFIEREENYNKLNPNYARKIKPYDEIYQEKLRYLHAIPRKFGFDSCGLGWKTKWKDTDYRFEWSPVFSFVCFGYQIALTVHAPHSDQYWSAWLYYERNTDKTKSKQERIEQCKKDFPQTYTSYSRAVPEGETIEQTIDYYELILRKKYIK